MKLKQKFKYCFKQYLTTDSEDEKLEKVLDDFAIGFAEWLQYNYYADETIKQQLEIYKNQKGL